MATQKVGEIGGNVNDKFRDGVSMNDIQNQVTDLGSKVADFGRKGWQEMSSIFNKKFSSYTDPNSESSSQPNYNEIGGSYQNEGPRIHTSFTSPSLSSMRDDKNKPSNNSNNSSSNNWDDWWTLVLFCFRNHGINLGKSLTI